MSIASNTQKQYTTYNENISGYGLLTGPQRQYLNTHKTYGAMAGKYMDAAEGALKQMVSAAQGAVDSTNKGNAALQDSVNGSITNMQTQADKMNATADKIGTQAGAVNDWAGKVGGVAESLTPYAQAMKDYGSAVYGQGQTLVDQGNALLGTWSNFAPLVGKYTSALQSLDPNNQVSLAAHDVQSSYQNAQGQNQRAMARMGVDPSSGAYQAQKAQWDQALATALAGAKTRARNQGLNEQVTALAQGLGMGSNLAQAGAQIGSQGTTAMTQAGGLLGQAADILNTQGGLYGTAGQLAGTAGSLMGSQAGIYGDAGQLQQAAGTLALNLGAQTQQQTLAAQQLLQSALASASSYYNSQAAGFAQLAGRNGLLAGMTGYSGKIDGSNMFI